MDLTLCFLLPPPLLKDAPMGFQASYADKALVIKDIQLTCDSVTSRVPPAYHSCYHTLALF